MKDFLLDYMDELNLEYLQRMRLKNFFRMKSGDYEIRLNLVAPIIKKKDTSFRRGILVHEHLAVTLRFLATGNSYQSLSEPYR